MPVRNYGITSGMAVQGEESPAREEDPEGSAIHRGPVARRGRALRGIHPGPEGICYTQGRSLDQAMWRIREAAELWLEIHREQRGGSPPTLDLVGVQQLEIPVGGEPTAGKRTGSML
jgi:predicted RNase H-like HicB family nuclease